MLFTTACNADQEGENSQNAMNAEQIMERRRQTLERYARIPVREHYEGLSAEMVDLGLVNVQDMDSSIQVALVYASQNNFLDTAIYGDFRSAFLLIEAAAMLSIAQEELQRRKPGYRLLIYDAARPKRIQQAMWERVKDSPQAHYVANPAVGSLHNYGAAVDLGILDAEGRELDLGTPFDHFGPLSQPRHEQRYLRTGELLPEHVEHRRLLREVMKFAGFSSIPNEWWHFNAFTLKHVRENYSIIE